MQRWRRSNESYIECATIRASLPIRHRRSGGPIDAEIEVAVNTTLESAGQRVAPLLTPDGEHSLSELDLPVVSSLSATKRQIRSSAERRRRRLMREQDAQ